MTDTVALAIVAIPSVAATVSSIYATKVATKTAHVAKKTHSQVTRLKRDLAAARTEIRELKTSQVKA